jgi:hypothetical protein
MTKNSLQLMIHKNLAEIGFSRSGFLGVSICDLGEYRQGFVGVHIWVRRGEGRLSVDPNVGVAHIETERLWAEFSGRPPEETLPPTVFKNIGYLIPAHTFRGYLLENTTDPTDTIQEIMSDMRTYALPWMHDLCDMEKLTALAEKDTPDYAAYRVPILRALQGQPEKALAAMEYYKGRRLHVPAFLERYAKFEVWFRERLLNRS